MTGFGEASGVVDGIHYFVEVRSLNSRYFKATIRLPDALQALEAEMEALLRRRLARGTITATGTCTEISESAAFTINHLALERYLEQLRRVPGVASGQAAVDVAALLTLPGVLQPPSDEESRLRRAREAFFPLLHAACDALIAMRQREGQFILEDLARQRDVIADRLEKIAARAPAVAADFEHRLRTRIENMLNAAGLRVEPVELIREVAACAERADIAEELSRLRGHLSQFERLIQDASGRPVGRVLDFLAQEMLREANTLAAKSADADISRAIVEVKAAIDRIKEQAQNVE